MELEKALRDYETAHAKYMSLSVFSEEGKEAKIEMKKKEAVYISEMKKANPDMIIF